MIVTVSGEIQNNPFASVQPSLLLHHKKSQLIQRASDDQNAERGPAS